MLRMIWKISVRGFLLTFFAWNFISCSHIPIDQRNKEKIVLVHGYGRSPSAMWRMSEFFEKAGYQVYNIGYRSITQDIDGIKDEFYSKVDKYLSTTNQKVHFIGHSMGGLLIRSYLGERKVHNMGNVVIMGSPNKGTPVVDKLKEKWYFPLGGPAIKSLSAKGSSFLRSLKRPYYKLGVIAGIITRPKNKDLIPGKDDGLVPFESTKVEGMKDMIVLPVSHYMMRYDQLVFNQVLYFIKNSEFKNKKLAKLATELITNN